MKHITVSLTSKPAPCMHWYILFILKKSHIDTDLLENLYTQRWLWYNSESILSYKYMDVLQERWNDFGASDVDKIEKIKYCSHDSDSETDLVNI